MKQRLDKWPRLAPGDGKQLQKFADYLGQVYSTMANVPELRILNNVEENEKLANKLSGWLKTSWARKIRDARRQEDRYPTFGEFVTFVNDEAELLSEPILEKFKDHIPGKQGRDKHIHSLSTAAAPTPTPRPKKECFFCKKDHLTANC